MYVHNVPCLGCVLPFVKIVQEQETEVSQELRTQKIIREYKEDQEESLKLLQSYGQATFLTGEALGQTTITNHEIKLKKDARPSYIKSYRLSHSQREIVDEKVKDMLQQKVITPSDQSLTIDRVIS